jgi:pseudouridine synthase
MLNKPVGIVTSLKDEKGRTVVTDLIEGVDERIYPVGRLDSDTSGLLLLTNDGELAFKLTHPSKRIFKKYIAIVEGLPNKGELERLRNGIKIDGRVTSKAKVKVLKNFGEDSILEIEIFEGRNRQVKKMCEAVNHPVKKLKRVAFGELQLGGLESGNWRYLNDEELAFIRSL